MTRDIDLEGVNKADEYFDAQISESVFVLVYAM